MLKPFKVHDVKRGKRRKSITNDALKKAWEVCRQRVEYMSHIDNDPEWDAIEVFSSPNLFAYSVYLAFFEHLPLLINPNVVWLTILQGFSRFASKNSESLRPKLVHHDGVMTIEIERPDFVKGSPTNDWASLINDFKMKITSKTLPGVVDNLECSFSNTTPIDSVASNIAVMDIMKKYFKYVARGGCGFPEIQLLGTLEDWVNVKSKTEYLKTFKIPEDTHLEKWIDALLPVLDHFILAAEGHPDIDFWGSCCNLCGMSGCPGDAVTGWIGVFFPYNEYGQSEYVNSWEDVYNETKKLGGAQKSLEKAERVESFKYDFTGRCERYIAGRKLESFPCGIFQAPVEMKWGNTGVSDKLSFNAGTTVLYQRKSDGALDVRCGWSICRYDVPQFNK